MSKQIVGLDIGYGFTKATDGERTVIFPSVGGDVVMADFDNDLVKAGSFCGNNDFAEGHGFDGDKSKTFPKRGQNHQPATTDYGKELVLGQVV